MWTNNNQSIPTRNNKSTVLMGRRKNNGHRWFSSSLLRSVWMPLSSFLLLSPSTVFLHGQVFNDARFDEVIEKMEDDTLEFAKQMEIFYNDRCMAHVIVNCAESSYAECKSELPMAQCLDDPAWTIPTCAGICDGVKGALFDFTTSSVRLSQSSDFSPHRRDSSVIESICYSQSANLYMTEKYERDASYWADLGVNPPWLHFGTDSGVFRIFPGRPRNRCDDYDPRIRPWYVGASSGPKDVVLVLDTSGSMNQYGRLEAMQDAAARVIGTLGLQDYVSVVQFNTVASRLSPSKYLLRATKENKDFLITQLYNLEAAGKTDFYRGFELAFQSLIESAEENEVSAGCHQAILFLTDGEMNSDTYDEEDVFSIIDAQRNIYASKGKKFPTIFTFSFGGGNVDESLPRAIACSTEGIWSRILDGEDLAESMAGYYKYFAYGLGDSTNNRFVSWTEPYKFATGGQLGVTSSAPVYDRSVQPHILVGVVGLDLTLAALERALGQEGSVGLEEVIRRLAQRSIANCPALSLTECNIQSLRSLASSSSPSSSLFGGSAADRLCPVQCTPEQLTAVTPSLCDTDDHPTDVWDNVNNEGRNYIEKACCEPGEIRTPGQLPLEEIQRNNNICNAMENENSNSGGSTIQQQQQQKALINVLVALFVAFGQYLV